MSRAQWIVIFIAALICVGMLLYPPYETTAFWTDGPVYAPIWNPPAVIETEANVSIDQAVLSGQCALVLLPAVVLILGLLRPPIHNRAELLALCTGAAVIMVRILYPPEIGGGPLGIHFGTGFLFHHAREYSIYLRELGIQLFAIAFVTFGALLALHQVKARRLRALTY